jgi:hypothetical protein
MTRQQAGVPTATTSFQTLATTYDAAVVRAWAIEQQIEVSHTGGLPKFVYELYAAALAQGTPAP